MATNTDLERIYEVEEAISRGDREAALRILSDFSVFDAAICDAMTAVFDGDLDTARVACTRARDLRERAVAA